MDWPYDPDGEEGSEGGRKYGLAVIAKKLDGDAFPLTKTDLLETIGDHPVRLDHEDVMAVADLLTAMEEGPFEDREALLAAAGNAMREKGNWTLEPERYQ